MKRNKYIRFVFMSLALSSMVLGVSLFFAILVSACVAVILKTDSAWVFLAVGGPLTIMISMVWTIKRWSYVKAFVTGDLM